jgi:hypothetical protein
MKSDIGQCNVSLFNDQISLQFSPATGKTEYGTIKYNGSPQVTANVRFSVGVGAAIAKVITDKAVPAAEKGQQYQSEIYACKRGNYESWVRFEVADGKIIMTGLESNNGQKKNVSYAFPPTLITGGGGAPENVQGEALAFANLLSEIGSGNESPLHMRQYNQAVKDNMPQGGFGGGNQGGFNQQNNQQSQSMGSWSPQ